MTWCEIPVADKDRPEVHPFLCPHDVFGALHNEKPDRWMETIRGEDGATTEFWKSQSRDPDVRDHPGLDVPQKTIPLGIHGDGGSFSKADSLLTISWNSLLGVGTTNRTRYIFTTSGP